MRVIHVLDHSVPLRTAYASRTLAMLAELRGLGWETFQITGPKQGPAAAAEEEVDGWTFHRTPPPGGILEGVPVLGELELMGEITYRIEKVARRVRPHLVHAHSPVLNALPALRVARRLRIPAIYEVRSLWEEAAAEEGGARRGGLRYRASRGLDGWAIKHADAVITVTNALREDLVSRGVPAAKISVIPHAVDARVCVPRDADPALRKRLGLEGRFVVGLLGPFHAYEGAAIAVEAIARLRAAGNEAALLLVGGGPELARIREQAAHSGVANAVAFAGDTDDEALARHCAIMDVLASPRLSTRLTQLVSPYKILEAMARRCVVVASALAGHSELIRDGATGVLVPPGDAAALAAALLALKRDPQRRTTLGDAARQYAAAERSWKANALAYQQVYARLLERQTVH
ncbi:MAG: glycosyltransferase family 4 protein [Betaproteobacteria bacterium]